MRFIIVRIRDERIPLFAPLLPYRATAVKDDGESVDVFFWALNLENAERKVVAMYPNATFSHHTPGVVTEWESR